MLRIDWRKRIKLLPIKKEGNKGYMLWSKLNNVEYEYLEELILEIIKQTRNND